ncbi:MAG TPA: serine/threonine-protein kinase [Polyangiaceae bacterium]|jgi:serine/threonine-protein kinase|nr:serine/threonine-protein kinase [Polyangiaceae bacterium]
MPSPLRFTPGTSVGRYEVVRVIASGGGGTVLEAIDGSLRRRVAVKVLHVADPEGPQPKRVERFLREVRIAAQIRHPHVVDVLDVGLTDGVPFLVMELVDGDTLEQLVAQEGPLPLARVVAIALPLLSAVVELHDNGVVHRDLKPANVLMGPGPALWPKLADFGVAAWTREREGDADASVLTQAGMLIGTPEYLAPEIIRAGGRGTERSDVYSLGVLLYECATGRKPFTGTTMYERLDAAVRAPVAPPSAHAPSLPPAFDALVLRALHRDPARRFASARELAEALVAFAPQAVAARWSAEFAPVPSVSLPQSARVESRKSRRASGRESSRPVRVQTFDGVALSTRGDVLSMVWQSSARLPRTRWAFDCIERFAAETGESFLVLMVTLPSAYPPDAQARQENDRRIAAVGHRVRKFATVVTGDSVWQTLIRGVIRAMVLPYRSLAGGGASTIDATVEGGVRSLLRAAGPRTPPFERILGDVQALYAALGEEAPARDDARRSRSGVALRKSAPRAAAKGGRKPARSA